VEGTGAITRVDTGLDDTEDHMVHGAAIFADVHNEQNAGVWCDFDGIPEAGDIAK
jgi:hypothetical protein